VVSSSGAVSEPKGLSALVIGSSRTFTTTVSAPLPNCIVCVVAFFSASAVVSASSVSIFVSAAASAAAPAAWTGFSGLIRRSSEAES